MTMATNSGRHPDRYGNFYWCIKTPLSANGEVYVNADELRVDATGALLCIGHQQKDDTPVIHLAFASGQWQAFYAASVLDGHPIIVDHWSGEIVE